MATKHSFQCKLSQHEQTVLRVFNRDQFISTDDRTAEHLSARGLLVCRYQYHEFFGGNLPTNNYRLSKRGELMLQRYDAARAPRDWVPPSRNREFGYAPR